MPRARTPRKECSRHFGPRRWRSKAGRAGESLSSARMWWASRAVVADEVAARVEKQYGLKRSQLLINASHTHTGPVVWPNLENLTVFPPAEQEKLLAYQRKFVDAW